jgi:potassium voltage-gated channel Eag-related subfamily H protein 7
MVDGSFAVDMGFTFFAAFYDDETQVVTDRKKITKSYLFGWFLIDFLSIFPFETLLASGDFAGLAKIFRVSKIYKIVKIARLIRIFKFMKQR